MCLFYCGVVPEILKNETPQTHFPFALVVFFTADASTTIKAFLQFFPSLQMLENAQGCLSTDFLRGILQHLFKKTLIIFKSTSW